MRQHKNLMTLRKKHFQNIVGKWVNAGTKTFSILRIVLALLNTNICTHKINHFLIDQIVASDEKHSMPFFHKLKRSIFIFSKFWCLVLFLI